MRSIWRSIGSFGVATLALPGLLGAAELRAPQNVSESPGTRQSSALATRAAKAEMQGRPAEAIQLANQAIQASPSDPWPYYDKGMALARMGQTDQAITSLTESEQHFAPRDLWGKSIAMWGKAHTYSQARRCPEARAAFERYASFVANYDPASADLARRYAAECRPLPLPPGSPAPAAPEIEPLPPPLR